MNLNVFQKLGSWLTAGKDPQQVSSVNQLDPAVQNAEESNAEAPRQVLDPFGNGEERYGGRTVYRSRMERQAAAEEASIRNQVPQNSEPASVHFGAQPQQPVAYAQPETQPDYRHAEYIVLLRSRNECKDVIAYMKTNASVFLNMEFIASDSDRQRCVDMLSGAAYTLGCTLNKLSTRGMYLISSPAVRVVLDPAMQKMAVPAESHGYTAYGVYPQSEQEATQSTVQNTQPVQPVQTVQPPVSRMTRQARAAQQNMPDAAQQASFAAGNTPTMRFQTQGLQSVASTYSHIMTGSEPYQNSASGM